MRPVEIQAIDFARRRETFLRKIPGAVAVFPSARDVVRNADVHHPYRQDSSFFYLTGFDEPNSFCLLSPGQRFPYQIFVQPRDKHRELWEGKVLGAEMARSRLGADAAFPSVPDTHFDEALVMALLEADSLYYRVGVHPELDQRVFRLMDRASRRLGRTGRPLWPIHDPADILGEMRIVKHRAEVERLERASFITSEAHVNAMRITKPGMFEYEVEAALYHSFRVHGADRVGYGSIVASGPNACTLHYTANRRKMMDKDLLLIDAGAECDYYTADITRVFPVNGAFSNEQREVYGAVLKAQKECIALAKPGKTLADLHRCAVEALVEELKKIKVLKGPTSRIIKNKEYVPYYPHGTSHWLGMDVHDTGRYYTGDYSSARKLTAGMVCTVEPGLYFSPDGPAPARYRGIGIRIEDDILITSNGCKVLTSGVPKEIDEVESLCSHS